MQKNNLQGFTLIELLVVIAIIGLLSTLSVLALKTVRSKARDTARLSDIEQISSALAIYYNDHEFYPKCNSEYDSDSDWETGCFATAMAPYMSKLPIDPLFRGDIAGFKYWGNGRSATLSYIMENSNPNIHSFGNWWYDSGYSYYGYTKVF